MKIKDLVSAFSDWNKSLKFYKYKKRFNFTFKYNNITLECMNNQDFTKKLIELGYGLEMINYLYNTNIYCDEKGIAKTLFGGKELIIKL